MNLNKVILCGRLTRDPEVRYAKSGSAVVSFSVATNRTWRDQQGAEQREVEFHSCVAYGATAEAIGQYMTKGSTILIEGRLHTSSWDGQEGTKRYRTDIVCERVQFGPKPSGETREPEEARQPGSDDDIPF